MELEFINNPGVPVRPILRSSLEFVNVPMKVWPHGALTVNLDPPNVVK